MSLINLFFFRKRDLMVAPAVNLLNSNLADFDAVKVSNIYIYIYRKWILRSSWGCRITKVLPFIQVLQSLPENWSVGLVSQFLTNSVRKSLHMSRMTRVERNLARGDNLNTRRESINLTQETVNMTEDRYCLNTVKLSLVIKQICLTWWRIRQSIKNSDTLSFSITEAVQYVTKNLLSQILCATQMG